MPQSGTAALLEHRSRIGSRTVESASDQGVGRSYLRTVARFAAAFAVPAALVAVVAYPMTVVFFTVGTAVVVAVASRSSTVEDAPIQTVFGKVTPDGATP